MMIIVSPLLTEKLTPFSTVRGPNFLTRSRTSMTGSDMLAEEKNRGKDRVCHKHRQD